MGPPHSDSLTRYLPSSLSAPNFQQFHPTTRDKMGENQTRTTSIRAVRSSGILGFNDIPYATPRWGNDANKTGS